MKISKNVLISKGLNYMAQTWKSIKEAVEKAGITDETLICYIDIRNTCCEDDPVKIVPETSLNNNKVFGIIDA